MKKFTKLTLVAAALSSSLFVSQSALAEVSANIGVTSNYLWRGVSQSSDDASVSGGIDYSSESGVYAGTWIGSLGGGGETDFYFGYAGESGSFAYDVGYIYYAYTDDELSNDFGELYFNGGFGNFGFGIAVTTNTQSDVESLDGAIYYNLGYGGIDLGNEFELGLTVGAYTYDEDGVEDYSHFQADVSKGDFVLSISKATSDSGDDDLKFVASWSTSF